MLPCCTITYSFRITSSSWVPPPTGRGHPTKRTRRVSPFPCRTTAIPCVIAISGCGSWTDCQAIRNCRKENAMWFRSVVGGMLVLLTAQGPQAESGQFTLTQAGKQISTERYTRSAAGKDGELRTSVGLRITYAAQLTNGSVSYITLKVYGPTDSVKPRQTAQVRFRADSLTLETIRQGALVVEKRAAPQGA